MLDNERQLKVGEQMVGKIDVESRADMRLGEAVNSSGLGFQVSNSDWVDTDTSSQNVQEHIFRTVQFMCCLLIIFIMTTPLVCSAKLNYYLMSPINSQFYLIRFESRRTASYPCTQILFLIRLSANWTPCNSFQMRSLIKRIQTFFKTQLPNPKIVLCLMFCTCCYSYYLPTGRQIQILTFYSLDGTSVEESQLVLCKQRSFDIIKSGSSEIIRMRVAFSTGITPVEFELWLSQGWEMQALQLWYMQVKDPDSRMTKTSLSTYNINTLLQAHENNNHNKWIQPTMQYKYLNNNISPQSEQTSMNTESNNQCISENNKNISSNQKNMDQNLHDPFRDQASNRGKGDPRSLCCEKIMMLALGTVLICVSLYWVYSIGNLTICVDQPNQNQQPRCLIHTPLKSESESQQFKSRPLKLGLSHSLPRNPTSIQKSLTLPSKKHKPTPQALFAFQLHEYPDDIQYQSAEYQYYNSKYQIAKYGTNQMVLCVVSTGRNLEFQARYRGYFRSLNRQKYQNYVVVVVDDWSSDNTVAIMKLMLEEPQYVQLKNRTIIIENIERKYALYNRDVAITKYCPSSSIIVEIDTDDQLIGSYVFSTINALYSSDPTTWILYSSYIFYSPKYNEPSEGISNAIPQKILLQGSYRETAQWYTSALRTFRKQLYQKIDKSDFIEKQYQRFYKWTSDLFVHYSLVEMSGREHYRYVHEIFYFYYKEHNRYQWVQKAINRLHALKIKPYQQLGNLQQIARRKEDERDLRWIQKEISKLEKCKSFRNDDQECSPDI